MGQMRTLTMTIAWPLTPKMTKRKKKPMKMGLSVSMLVIRGSLMRPEMCLTGTRVDRTTITLISSRTRMKSPRLLTMGELGLRGEMGSETTLSLKNLLGEDSRVEEGSDRLCIVAKLPSLMKPQMTRAILAPKQIEDIMLSSLRVILKPPRGGAAVTELNLAIDRPEGEGSLSQR
jgi:hypothetical protein